MHDKLTFAALDLKDGATEEQVREALQHLAEPGTNIYVGPNLPPPQPPH